eukprot:388964-Amphidinium_carterae.1
MARSNGCDTDVTPGSTNASLIQGVSLLILARKSAAICTGAAIQCALGLLSALPVVLSDVAVHVGEKSSV